MNNDSQSTPLSSGTRSIWIRGLIMLLMALAYQLVSTLLFAVAVIQFILALINDTANPRLMAFGRSLGRYQGQVANFVSFASEDPPFPFSDWPAKE